MAAFLDDRWYENRKWELLEDRGPRIWADCFAVWGAANAYCKANRTGGEITLRRLEKITPLKRSRLKTIAFELCSVELFDQTGHETWSFRNWNEWNRHENDPETTRKKNRDRQRRHREKKQENTECNGVTESDSHAGVTARDTGPAPPYRSSPTDPVLPSPQTPQGAGVSEAVPARGEAEAPPELEPWDIWVKFEPGFASNYLAELAEQWPGLSVPAGRMSDAARGLFAHFAKLEPDERTAAFQRLAKAYRADRFLPTIVWKFLAESDLTKVANGSAGPAKTTGPAPPAPHSAHGLGEVKF